MAATAVRKELDKMARARAECAAGNLIGSLAYQAASTAKKREVIKLLRSDLAILDRYLAAEQERG